LYRFHCRFAAEDPVYEKAVAECCVIKESTSFSSGILLKCIDKQRKSLQYSGNLICPLSGTYEEIYSIQKTVTANADARLPSNRHAGYIVIGFKLLDDSSKQETLEKSWLSWSGAREIYKYSPRTWSLRRIGLRKLIRQCRQK
uniref:GGACT domain-containing protein n=1 Tax=Angiostrongylus cantonensis TaxID=6313 RepID=A0A0K0DP07_ANGCA